MFIDFGLLKVNLDIPKGIHRVTFDPVKAMDLRPLHLFGYTYAQDLRIKAAKKNKSWGRGLSDNEAGRERAAYYHQNGGFFYLKSYVEEKAERTTCCVVC